MSQPGRRGPPPPPRGNKKKGRSMMSSASAPVLPHNNQNRLASGSAINAIQGLRQQPNMGQQSNFQINNHSPKQQIRIVDSSEFSYSAEPNLEELDHPEYLHVKTNWRDLLIKAPNAFVGVGKKMNGLLKYKSLMRVDGEFKGNIDSRGHLIVGPTGLVRSNQRCPPPF